MIVLQLYLKSSKHFHLHPWASSAKEFDCFCRYTITFAYYWLCFLKLLCCLPYQTNLNLPFKMQNQSDLIIELSMDTVTVLLDHSNLLHWNFHLKIGYGPHCHYKVTNCLYDWYNHWNSYCVVIWSHDLQSLKLVAHKYFHSYWKAYAWEIFWLLDYQDSLESS